MTAALWAGSAIPALAADNGTVDATVTVATPCLVVTPPSLDFGTLPFSTLQSQSSAAQNAAAENCGTSAEQIFVRGTNATVNGDLRWALIDTSLPCYGLLNEYAVSVRNALSEPGYISTTDRLIESVAASASSSYSVGLVMPCVGSDGIGETISFQAIFTATF